MLSDIIQALYYGLLGRAPDEEGLQAYSALARAGRWKEVVGGITHSPEFHQLWLALSGYEWRADPAIAPFLRPEAEDLAAHLQACGRVSWGAFSRQLEEIQALNLVIGQDEYLPTHARRFHELFNAALILLEEREAPRILEFGVSEFSRLYRLYFPRADLVTADRPVAEDYPGFRPETVRRVTASPHHAAIDLERTPPDECHALVSHAPFDLIVFTEVLEHLDTHPVPILRGLSRLLAAEGHIYLTTPNFFRRENLERIVRRENPQEVYPVGEDNWDAHHHHREYAMGELLAFCQEAGLAVETFYFSGCWDERPLDLAEDQRGNLVVVATAA